MTVTLYETTVPILANSLTALKHILDVAEKHAAEKGIALSELVEARLAPDMLPLFFQVHVVTDTAQKTVARLHGTEPLAWQHTLTSFEEMKARIAEAVEIVKSADKEKWAARENETITMGTGGGNTASLKSAEYLSRFVIPNLFFHLATAYGILRMKGVPLGKNDYLTGFRTW